MKDREHWKSSKYSLSHGRLKPSRDSRELSPSSRPIGKLLADRYQPALAMHARGRLLDLGCGKILLYAAYRDYISDNVCIDWPDSLHDNIHVDRFCDLAQPLPFANDSFDTILLSDVIEHLPDPLLAFKEMGRLLRPGGKLILNTPFMYMLHEIPHDYCRHTRYSLDRLTRLAELEPLSLDEIGSIGDIFSDLSGKAMSMTPLIGKQLSIAAQLPAMLLGHTHWWRHDQKASATRFPIGYFLIATKPIHVPGTDSE